MYICLQDYRLGEGIRSPRAGLIDIVCPQRWVLGTRQRLDRCSTWSDPSLHSPVRWFWMIISALNSGVTSRKCNLHSQTPVHMNIFSPTAFLSSFVMNSGVWKEVGCAKLWNEWCRTTDTVHLSPTDAFCVFYQLKSDPSVCGPPLSSLKA